MCKSSILSYALAQTINLVLCIQAFIGRSWALLRPWGLLMSSIRALAARNRGRSGRRRALLVGTYRCAELSELLGVGEGEIQVLMTVVSWLAPMHAGLQ
jgi:hypothetical protein